MNQDNDMAETRYTASKSRSNRPGWSVSFRHPLRRDARGRLGLKVRRGLGTADEAKADRLVEEMNVLLADRSWWNATRRADAGNRFSKIVVDAFYDEIQAGRGDPESLREESIPLPDNEEGYSRVLFVGTTGAGKTSLLRQLIDSDPDRDRFPSTAPAKTTIADIEVVQGDGNYQAAVTFFTEFQTQSNVEECIVDSCLATLDRQPTDKVAERFLSHRDQKFRLGYILGGGSPASGSENTGGDEFSFDAEDETSDKGLEDEVIPESEQTRNREALRGFLDRVALLAASAEQRLLNDLGTDPSSTSGPDRETAKQLIEENFEAYISQEELFHELSQDVLDCVRERFDQINEGTLERHRSGWPKRWTFETVDRDKFIAQIRWFSSNDWRQFGRLLTPLVDGIRVKGPLFPSFTETAPQLVLIDGQGLGHTPDSSSSVTTHITRRFDRVDVILLVDNAQQPMQAAPLSVLRTVAHSGHSEKLAIAFTHFDQIKGLNLPSLSDQRDHVMASVLNALSNLRDDLGMSFVRSIEHGIDDRCFMLGGVDRNLGRLQGRAANYMRDELRKLIRFFEKAIQPPPPPKASPVYDPSGIPFAVREAVSNFQRRWLALLGLASHERVRKEHWTRVKALNRRIAGETDDEYGTLTPVADLVARLNGSVSRFLDEPIEWTREPGDDQERQAAIARIQRVVSSALHELAFRRIVERHLSEWRAAYEFRGRGSTFERARAIRGIYDNAAPLLDAVMPPPSKQFLAEVRGIVVNAIKTGDGEVSSAIEPHG